MINYFEAAEKTLRARGLLETALGNLERKKERILRYGAPSEYPSADMSKPYTGAKSVNDALADCLELAEVMREIQVTRDKVEEIDDVLAQMDEADVKRGRGKPRRRAPRALCARRSLYPLGGGEHERVCKSVLRVSGMETNTSIYSQARRGAMRPLWRARRYRASQDRAHAEEHRRPGNRARRG